jgi:hypothetical protein
MIIFRACCNRRKPELYLYFFTFCLKNFEMHYRKTCEPGPNKLKDPVSGVWNMGSALLLAPPPLPLPAESAEEYTRRHRPSASPSDVGKAPENTERISTLEYLLYKVRRRLKIPKESVP